MQFSKFFLLSCRWSYGVVLYEIFTIGNESSGSNKEGLPPTTLCFIINFLSQFSWYLADCSFKTEPGHDFKDNLSNKAEKGATFSMRGQPYRGHLNAIVSPLFSGRLSVTCVQHLYIAEETLGSRLIYIFLLHIVEKTFAQFSFLFFKIFNLSPQPFLWIPPKIAY